MTGILWFPKPGRKHFFQHPLPEQALPLLYSRYPIFLHRSFRLISTWRQLEMVRKARLQRETW
jgi:hypothetical protein